MTASTPLHRLWAFHHDDVYQLTSPALLSIVSDSTPYGTYSKRAFVLGVITIGFTFATMKINECKFAKPTYDVDPDTDRFLGFDGVGFEDVKDCAAYSRYFEEGLYQDVSTEANVLGAFSKLVPSLFLVVALYEFQTLFNILPENKIKLVGFLFAILAGLNAVNFAFFGSEECELFSSVGENTCSFGPGSIMTIVGCVLLGCNSALAFRLHQNLDPEWEDSIPEEASSTSGAAASKKNTKDDNRVLTEVKINPGKIGLTIALENGHHTVISIKEDSANKEKFRVGDHVKMVNGQDVTKKTNTELLEIISGSANEQRTILVNREERLGCDV